MNTFFICVCAFIALSLDVTQGLRCYTCSYDDKHSESNILCVTAPWNLTGNPIRTCLPHQKFCIIVRIDSKATGKVSSFLRKCEENPTEDSDVESQVDVAHFRSCTTDLCNKGDGLDYIDIGYEGGAVAILVPDKNSSATNFPSFLSLIALFFVYRALSGD